VGRSEKNKLFFHERERERKREREEGRVSVGGCLARVEEQMQRDFLRKDKD
jgi:hypothetical protein